MLYIVGVSTVVSVIYFQALFSMIMSKSGYDYMSSIVSGIFFTLFLVSAMMISGKFVRNFQEKIRNSFYVLESDLGDISNRKKHFSNILSVFWKISILGAILFALIMTFVVIPAFTRYTDVFEWDGYSFIYLVASGMIMFIALTINGILVFTQLKKDHDE